jgi:fibronectin type 3 domain-containing protein
MRFRLVILLGVAALAGGCARKIDKVYDPATVAKVPVAKDLSATIADREVDLSWSVDPGDLGLVKRYLIYRADSGKSEYRVLDSSTAPSYTDFGVFNEVRYSYRVSVRNTDGIEGDQSSTVSVIPTLLAIRINADSQFTSRAIVGLEATAAGASYMRIANDTLQPGSWRPFQSVSNWTLSAGQGPKRVFAQFRLGGGIESTGWVFDDITFDDRAAILSVTISDSVLVPGQSMSIFVSTGETGGVATYSLGSRTDQKLFDDGVTPDLTAGDGIYSGTYVASSLELFEKQTLKAQFKDQAANRATETPAPWTVSVRQPPDAPVWVNIAAIDGEPTALNLTWTLGQASPFSQLLLRRSTVPGSGLSAAIVRTFTSASTTTVKDTGLTAAITYYYTLQVVLTNGLTALSQELSGQTPINLPPSAVTVAVTPTDDSSLALNWTKSTAADFASYRVYRADSASQLALLPSDDYLVDIISDVETTTHEEAGLTRFYYYRVFVFDKGGLSAGSNTVWGPKDFGP